MQSSLQRGPFRGHVHPDNLSPKYDHSQRARRDLRPWNHCAPELERIAEILWPSGVFKEVFKADDLKIKRRERKETLCQIPIDARVITQSCRQQSCSCQLLPNGLAQPRRPFIPQILTGHRVVCARQALCSVWIQLRAKQFLPRGLTGSQSWLHLHITQGALKNSQCPGHAPPQCNLIPRHWD